MSELVCKTSANGDKCWYLDDKLHREDGPAIECANGDKCWYRDGKCHREDGPAIEWADGRNFLYLGGIEYSSQEEFERALKLKAFW
jgi:hypothetical protein